ncbi:MAG: YjzC family protein [Planctomycetota bacterium]
MTTINAVRYKTGETCVITGHYLFDKYVDGSTTPSPTAEEKRIPLSRNETFPPIRSTEKACFWKREQ